MARLAFSPFLSMLARSNEYAQGGSPLLTCSMYKYCHYSNTAINKGGQTQPSGLLDYITQSDGWCKY